MMMLTPGIAQHPTIKAGGAKGYLQWLQTDPVMRNIYNQIRPRLVALISNGTLPGGPGTGNPGLAGLGQDSVDTSSLDTVSLPDLSNVPQPDIVTQQAPSSGTASNDWLSTVSSLVTAAGSAYSSIEGAQVANQANQLQLARAKSGLPPLNLSAYGVSTTPGLNLGLSSSTLGTIALVAVLGVVGIFILKKA